MSVKLATVAYEDVLPNNTCLDLQTLINEWNPCQTCTLYGFKFGSFAHKHVMLDVVEHGVVEHSSDYLLHPVDILMIGEAPGKSEDVIGRPFVGPAGRLLREAISEIDLSPNAGYEAANGLVIGFANLLACRPCMEIGGANQQPDTESVKNCSPRLIHLIEILRPNVIVCLGNIPKEWVPRIMCGMRYFGDTHCIKHPAALLRQGGKAAAGYLEYTLRLRQIIARAQVIRQKRRDEYVADTAN